MNVKNGFDITVESVFFLAKIKIGKTLLIML